MVQNSTLHQEITEILASNTKVYWAIRLCGPLLGTAYYELVLDT